MTPEKVQQMIQDALKNFTQAQQYGVSNVGFHTHNGVDSPVLKTPITFFTGSVGNGNVGIPNFLPTNWTAICDPDTLNYTITHNLGTTNYVFIPVPTENYDVPTVFKFANSVIVSWISVKFADSDQTNFDFLLIQPQAQQQLKETFTGTI